MRATWAQAQAPAPLVRQAHQMRGAEVTAPSVGGRCESVKGRAAPVTLAAVPIPDLLRALLVARGPSGHEEPAARVWREAASAFAEVHSDTLGTSFARVRAGDGAPTLALVGHIDEIGVAVTHVEENGLLSFTTIGGITPETLVGQRVRIAGRDGDVLGAIARKRLAPEQARDRPRLEHSDLHIDIGASDREDAERLVRPGDAGVWDGEPLELPNGRFVSKALDNRLGAYVALEAARRVAEGGEAQVDVVAVAAVQEEIGHYGARTAAFSLDPDVAIAIDVTYATDVPGGDPRTAGAVELGAGATIARGPIAEPARHATCSCARPRRRGSRTRSRSTRATRTPTPTRSTSRARASRPGSSRCRCATCTRRASSARSTTSRP